MNELHAKLAATAEASVLLVATDFDGTIAPIVADPAAAQPASAALQALRRLAAMPQTHVAVVSGRSVASLREKLGDYGPIHLFGSHGVEREGMAAEPTGDERRLLATVTRELRQLVPAGRGFLIETKPFAAVLHYRVAGPEAAEPVIRSVLSGPARLPGIAVCEGAMIVELAVRRGDKGAALNALRYRLGASEVVFFGDDRTDEDAFAALLPHEVAIKVGDGPSDAGFRVHGVPDVSELLVTLAERRAAFLQDRILVPLDHHAVLSDQRTMAVIAPSGRIVWLCLPRLDSGALFSELVAGPTGGSFEIAPTGSAHPTSQSYDGDSFNVVTRWPSATLTDYLDSSGGRAYQRAGRTDLIRVVEGSGRVAVRFAPRLDFGRMPTRLLIRDDGIAVEGTHDPICLYAPKLRWSLVDDGKHQTAVAEFEATDSPTVLELRYGTANLRASSIREPQRRTETRQFWTSWAASLRLPSIHHDLVKRSALMLKALCYGPTGAICAAATTSLPEYIGGVRNWDYRYCWPRDAAMAAAALVRLGNNGHALRLLDWILAIVDKCISPDRLRPIYTVHGGHLPPEAELGELPGYGGSRPVRVSNAAATQVQLDVFGPIVDLVATLAERGAPITGEHWRLAKAMVSAVEQRWHEPDHGIWEFRGPRQHHVHSKVMCWQTVNRALVVEEQLMGQRNPSWIRLCATIAADVIANGWNETRGAFTGAYGESWLDAAVLHVGLSGLLPPSDDRFGRTVDLIARELRAGPTVYRYRHDDGLPGSEGGFHICAAWLIEAFALLGRHTAALQLFDELTALAGPNGLFSEQYDPAGRLSLGNLPQAYSHLAIINAAVLIESLRATSGSPGSAPSDRR